MDLTAKSSSKDSIDKLQAPEAEVTITHDQPEMSTGSDEQLKTGQADIFEESGGEQFKVQQRGGVNEVIRKTK